MSFNRSGNWSPPTTVHPSELHAPLPPGYSYESLVPPFTTRTPGELLEKYYSERRSNPDRADPHAILRKQVEVFLNHPGNVGAPIGSQGLVGKWKRPNGLAAEPVPVYGTDLVPDGPRAVEFRDLDQEGPSTGTLPMLFEIANIDGCLVIVIQAFPWLFFMEKKRTLLDWRVQKTSSSTN